MQEVKTVRFGIFHKVLLTMVSVAVVPLLAVWYSNYLNSSERLEEHVRNQLQQGLHHLTHHVDGWVEMNRRMLRQNAAQPALGIATVADKADALDLGHARL